MSLLNKSIEKYCPRCNGLFTCMAGDIANCQCSEVQLSDDARNVLEKAYHDCLCSKCLTAINQEVNIAKSKQLPSK